MALTPRKRPTPAERLAKRLLRNVNGCLEVVTGCRDGKGYGRIHAHGRPTTTHRLAWELAHGLVTDGLWVLHHCDNPPCCQTEPTPGYPEGHLYLGTNADNVTDRMNRGRGNNNGRSQRTECPYGHPYDEENTAYVKSGARRCMACDRRRHQEAWALRTVA